MQMRCRPLGLFFVCALACAIPSFGQDSPSLGDVARQARLQKQQADKDAQDASKNAPAKDAQGKDTPGTGAPTKDATANAQPSKAPKKVITNDEIPEHVGPTKTSPTPYHQSNVSYPQPAGNSQAIAEQWKSQILGMKNYIASMQTQITQLEQSVQYAGGNCVTGCVQRNEREQQKQQQAEAMKQQVEAQQKQLEKTQEMLRRQGFGSSVYDP
jgi:hypothetical protein